MGDIETRLNFSVEIVFFDHSFVCIGAIQSHFKLTFALLRQKQPTFRNSGVSFFLESLENNSLCSFSFRLQKRDLTIFKQPTEGCKVFHKLNQSYLQFSIPKLLICDAISLSSRTH